MSVAHPIARVGAAVHAAAALCGAALVAHAAPPYEIVLVRGTMSDSQDVFVEGPTAGGSANPWGIADALCSNREGVRAALGLPTGQVAEAGARVLGAFGAVVGSALEQAAAPPRDDPRWEAWDEYEAVCDNRGSEASFNIIYSSCSMAMWSDDGVLRIVLPADGGEAEMVLTGIMKLRWGDMSNEQRDSVRRNCTVRSPCQSNGWTIMYAPPVPGAGFAPDSDEWNCLTGSCGDKADTALDALGSRRVRLERLFEGDLAEHVPKGELSKLVVEPRGGQLEMLGVPVHEYFFKYEGTMNPQMMPAEWEGQEFPFGEVGLISEGTAWISPDAPGTNVVRAFYANFEREVVPSADSETLLGGMIGHLSGLTQNGMPLRLMQETAVRITGLPTFGQKSFSEMQVSGVAHLLSNAEWCARNDVPADWQLVDVQNLYGPPQQGQAGATTAGTQAQTAGSPVPPGMPGAADQADAAAAMADAMTQMSAAMASMTPEQQQALEQFGLGAMAGANPAATGAGGAGPPANPAPGARAKPTSAALATDDLTQTAQNYLDALGYDPGNREGVMDTMTTVAISQFQAEKGLAVTGEVTPQLVGILAAEVDRARGN